MEPIEARSWTTPSDIQMKVRRLWESGRLLAAGLRGENLFPFSFSIAHPSPEDLSNRFEDARRWIQELEAGARSVKGFGYVIVTTEINYRRIGKNNLPTSVSLPDEMDALRLIGRVREAALFRTLSTLTLQKIPELETWMLNKPMKLLDHAEKWERLLAVLLWLRQNPQPKIYVRQMDLPGVDTKFIESCEGILIELFRAMTNSIRESLCDGKGDGKGDGLGESSMEFKVEARKGFAATFGFLSKPTLIRFRILDPKMHIQGLSDLSVPLSELASLSLPVKRVFITENDINGLAFPAMEESLVLFGLGYGVETLYAIPWLQKVQIIYWGDIDTHGFAILNRLRKAFPACRSILMDHRTLLAHRDFWVEEGRPTKVSLNWLTAEENSVYEDLLLNRLQKNLRLEQERIGFKWVEESVQGKSK